MPYLTNYHLREQQAAALLGPVCATLRELERRTWHYTERLAMEPAERETVQAAHHALTAAREEVERLWQASVPAGVSGTDAGREG
ncbi:MAG: hypothetical protein ACRDJN_10930 [Chloroflexota bacterium]